MKSPTYATKFTRSFTLVWFSMQVSLDESKDEILDLLTRLRSGTQAAKATSPGPDRAPDAKPTDPTKLDAWRADRAAEARADRKAKENKEKEKAALLVAELKAVTVQAVAATAKAPAHHGSTVRLTICADDRPSEKKIIVLPRAEDISELLKAGKAKLRMKRALSARLLDGGAPVMSTAGLADGSTVVLRAEPPAPDAPTSAPPQPPQPPPPPPPPPPSAPSPDDITTTRRSPGLEYSGRAPISAPGRLCALPQRLKGAAMGAAAAALEARLARTLTPAAKLMAAARAALPVSSHREIVTSAIEMHRAVLVQGEPGCGKSTQLPQYVLEDYIRRGHAGRCAIVVAQPRRVCAISLALRVAEERGEPLGETVGYAVRGEVRAGPHCRLLYCTTGWLLKQLHGCLLALDGMPLRAPSPPGQAPSGWHRLAGLSHVFIDEVHERSVLSDTLLTVLKALVVQPAAEDDDEEEEEEEEEEVEAMAEAEAVAAGEAAEGGRRRLNTRVIAMSATADAAFFSSYLCDAPLLSVPGRTFPVHTMHLEEVEVMVGCRAAKGVSLALDAAEVDGALLLATIEHVVLNGVPGAVLVFLSGAREIERCCAEIEGSRRLREVPLRVVPLHGSLPPAAQRRAFEVAPPGTRKVVVATNVAETSVTISDIVHVIDSGLVKSKGWNACTRLASLRDERVSSASAAQRRGRAGRVQEGHCYRLWPAKFRLMPQALPEMSRVPLEEIILDLSLLGAPSAASLLAQAPTPPSPTAVRAASQNLIELQAIELRVAKAGAGAGARGGAGGGLDGLVARGNPNAILGNPNAPSYQLTPLGWHMGSLPVDPRIGKMMLLAAVCGCLHPILSVAAALSLSGRSIFLSPHGKQVDASTAQRAAFGALRSDQLALAAAYDAWVEAREEGGARAERALCDRLFLNGQALREVERGRRELLHHLISAGFVPASVPGPAPTSVPASAHASDLAKAMSPHASDLALLRGIVCAALYPNVAAATRTTAQQSHACYEKLTLAGGELQAWMHPSSLNAQVEKAESGLYVFLEKVDTSRLFLRETSRVPPAALLLFGATPSELDVERVKQTGRVELGGGVRVRASPQTTLLFKLLRRELDDLLVRKARAPGTWPEREPAGVAVVETVRAVIGRFA